MIKKVIRVLIVEDHDATAFLIKMAFEQRGTRVDWRLSFVSSGQEALDYILRHGAYANAPRPDLVLLDWNLPKVCGQEVLRTLKSGVELRTIPVLVFSSSQDPHVVENAYSGHANGYIHKPDDLDSFCTVVENIERFWVDTVCLPVEWTTGTRA